MTARRRYWLAPGLVYLAQILTKTVQFPQTLLDAQALIDRQRLGAEPGSSLPAKQISSGTPLDQVRSEKWRYMRRSRRH